MESPVSEDGFPVSATTHEVEAMSTTTPENGSGSEGVNAESDPYSKDDLEESFHKQNLKLIEKMDAETEKDDNELMGEQITEQLKKTVPAAFLDTMMEMAQCPCCSEYYMGNVMQCKNGHTLCEECRKKLSECPTCKSRYGSEMNRNITYEMTLSKLNITVPCAFRAMGCTETVPYSQIHDHWRKCKFRPAECFIAKCGFKANTNQEYIEHLASAHRCLPTDTPDSEYFELPISSLMQSNKYTYSNVSPARMMIHPYNGDYLIFHFMLMSDHQCHINVFSLNKQYYVFSTNVEVPNMLYSNAQQFKVLPYDELVKWYQKYKNTSEFSTYKSKNMLWHSAYYSYSHLSKLMEFPTARINCFFRIPNESEVARMTKMDSDPNYPIMENIVEPTMTEEEAQMILEQSNAWQEEDNNPDVSAAVAASMMTDNVSDEYSDDDDNDDVGEDDM